MKKSYTIVVVDMQRKFGSSKRALPNVIKLLQQAAKDKATVIFVEYMANGPTIRGLKNLIPADKQITVIKNIDNGGEQVLWALDHTGWSRNLKICGVNLGACVHETAVHLYGSKECKVTIMDKACYDSDWRYIARYRKCLKEHGIKFSDKDYI